MPEHVRREIKLTINRSGTGLIVRHPAQIPSSVFLVLVVAYTAIAPNFDQPFISYAFASAAVFLVVVHASIRAWALAVIAAMGFSLCHRFFPQGGNVAGASLSLYAGMLGRGCFAALGWMTIWVSPEDGRRFLKSTLVTAGIVGFVLGSLVALNLTVSGRERVLDAYLYVFDGSLGFQPSFVLGQLFARYRLVAAVARGSYFALPLVIALASAGYLRSGAPWRPLAVLTSAGVLGYLLYWVFPATGPLYVAGASFPNSPHSFATLGQMHPRSITLPIPAPRNAMPSLHMAWALLLWFSCRPFSRLSRGFALAYVVLTIMATLGTGEHYLADLVVALPFSVAVQALWTPSRGITRYAVLAGATSLMLIWLLALRYGSEIFLLTPSIPWGCVIASIAISLAMERCLYLSTQSRPTATGASRFQ
jgi:PAP2 superfamily